MSHSPARLKALQLAADMEKRLLALSADVTTTQHETRDDTARAAMNTVRMGLTALIGAARELRDHIATAGRRGEFDHAPSLPPMADHAMRAANDHTLDPEEE